jgi:hypothetical protein
VDPRYVLRALFANCLEGVLSEVRMRNMTGTTQNT